MSDGMEVYNEPIKRDVSTPTTTPKDDSYFNRDRTLVLIDLFKKYKPALAKGDIKTMKEMWEIIATELTNQFGMPITGAKCQNKFKVLERGYKKLQSDYESGKRFKKHFPYAKEFKDLKLRKYEFVPGLVAPYTNINITTNTEKLDSSSTESAAEVTYTETVYVTDESYVPQTTNVEVTQTEYVNTTTEPIEAAEVTVHTSSIEQKVPPAQWSEDVFFNREKTLALISLFKDYAPQVAIGTIKTKKEMWGTIAGHMTDQFGVSITGPKCENRFKVLERNFKNLELHNSKRYKEGLPARRYEFEEELREIFGDKFKNLTEIKTDKIEPSTSNETPAAPTIDVNSQPFTIRVLEAQSIPLELPIPDKIERILLGIKADLQYYQNERLKVEWRKLAVEEEKLKLEKRKLKLLEEQKRSES